ncbi:MAG: hypothetical protein GYB32_04585 [Algicola sp.]|nr:hypothetical protein [Algicola sp.]
MFKQIKFLIAIGLWFMIVSCGNDDNNREEDLPQNIYEGCCSTEPVFGPNIDNLDQTAGEIEVYTIVTQNGDGINDLFSIRNIELYPNHSVTIYNAENEQIFQSTNYVNGTDFFPGYPQDEDNGANGIPNGTYRYKLVIENEETYRKSGSFCVYTWIDEAPNFEGCNLGTEFDPIIAFPPN